MPEPGTIGADTEARILAAWREFTFTATVVTYAAGPPATVTVRKNGQTATDGKSYRVAAHVVAVTALIAGDVVFLVDTSGTGGWIVMAKMP